MTCVFFVAIESPAFSSSVGRFAIRGANAFSEREAIPMPGRRRDKLVIFPFPSIGNRQLEIGNLTIPIGRLSGGGELAMMRRHESQFCLPKV